MTLLTPVQLLEGMEHRYQATPLPPAAGPVRTDREEVFFPDTTAGDCGRLRPGLYSGNLPVTVYTGAQRLAPILHGPGVAAPELWRVAGEPELWPRQRLQAAGYPAPGGDLYYCLELAAIAGGPWAVALTAARTAGMTMGVAVAVALWWWPMLARILDPCLVVLNAMPKIALGPILYVWLGEVYSIYGMAVAGAVVVTTVMAYVGFREVDPQKIKLMRTFGASKLVGHQDNSSSSPPGRTR